MALARSVQAINQSQIKQGSVAYGMDWKIKVSNYRYLEKDIFCLVWSVGQRKNSKALWEIKPQTFGFCAEVQFLGLTIFSLFHANDKTKNIFPYLFIKLKTCLLSYSKDTYYITVFIERRKISVQTNIVFNLKGPLLKGLFKQVRTTVNGLNTGVTCNSVVWSSGWV